MQMKFRTRIKNGKNKTGEFFHHIFGTPRIAFWQIHWIVEVTLLRVNNLGSEILVMVSVKLFPTDMTTSWTTLDRRIKENWNNLRNWN